MGSSGSSRLRDEGQLALLDAMVFFAVAMVICSCIACHALDGTRVSWEDGASTSEADMLLTVFLTASVGKPFSIGFIGSEITGYERFAEILFLLAAHLKEGCDEDCLRDVFTHCGEVLATICAPFSPVLRLSCLTDGSLMTLTEFGRPADGPDADASTQSLGMYGGTGLVATLVLSSACLLLHGVDV